MRVHLCRAAGFRDSGLGVVSGDAIVLDLTGNGNAAARAPAVGFRVFVVFSFFLAVSFYVFSGEVGWSSPGGEGSGAGNLARGC